MRILTPGAILTLWMLAAPLTGPSIGGAAPMIAAAPVHATSVADSPADAARDPADLGPTTAPPWNPRRPIPREQAWEAVMRFPGRIVSLPFVALGAGANRLTLYAEDHSLVPRTKVALARAPAFGVALAPASLGDRTGLGARFQIAPRGFGRFVRGEISGSLLGYERTRAELYQGPLTIRYGHEWRPEDRFYGIGLQSRESDVASIASQTDQVQAIVEWPWTEKQKTRITHPSFRAWFGPRSTVIRQGTHDPIAPSFDARFPGLGVMRDVRVEHLDWGGEAGWDMRGGAPHWSHGWRVLGHVERFDRPLKSLALDDAHARGAQFDRFEALAEAGGSFMRDPRSVRLRVIATHQEITGDPGHFLLTDLSRLGASTGLSGFSPGRFHDLDRLVGRLTYIFPLAMFYEFDVHAELGGVYPDVRHDARLATLKPSYGAALRPRSLKPIGSLGIDWSSESVRFSFSLGGVD